MSADAGEVAVGARREIETGGEKAIERGMVTGIETGIGVEGEIETGAGGHGRGQRRDQAGKRGEARVAVEAGEYGVSTYVPTSSLQVSSINPLGLQRPLPTPTLIGCR